MCRAFPGSDYYEGSAPLAIISGHCASPGPFWVRPIYKRFPRSLLLGRRVSGQLFPW